MRNFVLALALVAVGAGSAMAGDLPFGEQQSATSFKALGGVVEPQQLSNQQLAEIRGLGSPWVGDVLVITNDNRLLVVVHSDQDGNSVRHGNTGGNAGGALVFHSPGSGANVIPANAFH
jgi:hypothetical protein